MTYDPEKDRFKGRMPPKIWDAEELTVFDDPRKYKMEIRSMAMALSEDEVLSFYNLEKGDLPPYDLFFFETEFNRGRILAKQNAAAALMGMMETNKDAVMAYLTRFGGGEWTTKPESPQNGKTVPLHVVLAE